MVNVKEAAKLIDQFALMKYFPSDENARAALVGIVCEITSTDEQVRWLVKRALGIYAEWPGVVELRACFCSRFKPRDGINAYSTVYLDGIPSERPALAAAEQKALPPGEPVTADKRADAAFQIARATMELKSQSISGPATAEEIAAAPEWLKRLEGII